MTAVTNRERVVIEASSVPVLAVEQFYLQTLTWKAMPSTYPHSGTNYDSLQKTNARKSNLLLLSPH